MNLRINGYKLFPSTWNKYEFFMVLPRSMEDIKRELDGKINYKINGSYIIPKTKDDYNMLILLYGVYQ